MPPAGCAPLRLMSWVLASKQQRQLAGAGVQLRGAAPGGGGGGEQGRGGSGRPL
jgi:hypothetical protein